jgi:predicted nucleotidyltransferase
MVVDHAGRNKIGNHILTSRLIDFQCPMHNTLGSVGGFNMKMEELTAKLSPVKQRVLNELDVSTLYVFGSVARGEAGPDSDVDFLVDFKHPPSFARFMDLKFLLEDALGVHVDLVTRAALRESMKDAVEAEAERVA